MNSFKQKVLKRILSVAKTSYCLFMLIMFIKVNIQISMHTATSRIAILFFEACSERYFTDVTFYIKSKLSKSSSVRNELRN